MSEVVLTTGGDSYLSRKLIERDLTLGHQVMVPLPPTEEAPLPHPSKKGLHVLPWNFRSLLGTHLLLRENLRLCGPIDRALLILKGEPASQPSLEDLSLLSIRENIALEVTGRIFLIRELLRHYRDRDRVSLAFIIEPMPREQSLLQGIALESFRSLANSVLSQERQGRFFCGFSSDSPVLDEYADFIGETLAQKSPKNSGKWLKFTGKRGFFTSLTGG